MWDGTPAQVAPVLNGVHAAHAVLFSSACAPRPVGGGGDIGRGENPNIGQLLGSDTLVGVQGAWRGLAGVGWRPLLAPESSGAGGGGPLLVVLRLPQPVPVAFSQEPCLVPEQAALRAPASESPPSAGRV